MHGPMRPRLSALVIAGAVSCFAGQAVAQPAPGRSSAGVNATAPVFLLPDATRTPLRTLTRGTIVRIGEIREGWVEVTFNDPILLQRVGWMERRFLTFETSTPPPEAARPPSPTKTAAPASLPDPIATPGATSCARPLALSTDAWNLMSADQQAAACARTQSKPANWNLMTAAEQEYWLTTGTLRQRRNP